MGRTYGKPLLKFNPRDEKQAHLHWLNISKGNLFGGSLLAAFELYLVSKQIKDFYINLFVTKHLQYTHSI